MAESLSEPFDLGFLPHPVELPEVEINVFRHAKVHRSPAHRWLRSLVFDVFGEDKAHSPFLAHPTSGSKARVAV